MIGLYWRFCSVDGFIRQKGLVLSILRCISTISNDCVEWVLFILEIRACIDPKKWTASSYFVAPSSVTWTSLSHHE